MGTVNAWKWMNIWHFIDKQIEDNWSVGIINTYKLQFIITFLYISCKRQIVTWTCHERNNGDKSLRHPNFTFSTIRWSFIIASACDLHGSGGSHQILELCKPGFRWFSINLQACEYSESKGIIVLIITWLDLMSISFQYKRNLKTWHESNRSPSYIGLNTWPQGCDNSCFSWAPCMRWESNIIACYVTFTIGIRHLESGACLSFVEAPNSRKILYGQVWTFLCLWSEWMNLIRHWHL